MYDGQPVVCGRVLTHPGSLDRRVTGPLLAAMAPAALEVSLQATEVAQQRRAEVDRIWRQRLERADHAADRGPAPVPAGGAEPGRAWERVLVRRQQLGEE
ncbi:hypothetical protein ACWGLF_30885 [Streptomyces puniciscabiei]